VSVEREHPAAEIGIFLSEDCLLDIGNLVAVDRDIGRVEAGDADIRDRVAVAVQRSVDDVVVDGQILIVEEQDVGRIIGGRDVADAGEVVVRDIARGVTDLDGILRD